jgi:hypothetical protein
VQQPLKQLLVFFLQGGQKIMAKAPAAKKAPTKKAAFKKAVTKRSGRPSKAAQEIAQAAMAQATQKNAFEEKFGEGTAFDLDYGKLLIIALCVYIAVQVS